MTVIDTEAPVVEVENEEESTVTESKRGRNPDRDFSKFAQRHQDLADFINARSGLAPISPNIVKAVQLLSDDFRNTPEQVAARKDREEKRKAEDAEFAGLSPEEKKELRAANRRKKALEEVEERRKELLEKAKRIRESSDANGADVADAVNTAAEANAEDPDEGARRRPGARTRR